MKLYIVRHGETMFNVRRIVQGWCDSPLTERGIAQARAAGIGLRDIPFVHVYCSTSERTLDTALGILEGRDLVPEPRKDLKEMNFGEAEGEPMSVWFTGDDPLRKAFQEVGGESFEEAGIRALTAWKNIASMYEDGNVMIVTHGAAIMAGITQLDPAAAEKFRKEKRGPENCSVTILNAEGDNLTIEAFGDISYREKGEQGG